jgi:hypothetical protein
MYFFIMTWPTVKVFLVPWIQTVIDSMLVSLGSMIFILIPTIKVADSICAIYSVYCLLRYYPVVMSLATTKKVFSLMSQSQVCILLLPHNYYRYRREDTVEEIAQSTPSLVGHIHLDKVC